MKEKGRKREKDENFLSPNGSKRKHSALFFPSCTPREVPGSFPGLCAPGLGQGGDGFHKTLSGQLGTSDASVPATAKHLRENRG